ncbi:MAG: hypothetical protein ACRD8O_22495, partial [Bryobacteraceae bacterium]
HYTVLLDNPQVRVVRARYGPREKGVLHEHSGDRVVAFLTDQHMKVTPDGGAPEEARAKADEVRWLGRAKHSEENLSDRAFEVVVVELKDDKR